MDDHKGWYTRRKLPHFDGAELTQSITIRLADSLPREVIAKIKHELPDTSSDVQIERTKRLEAILDAGIGSCILREADCAK